MKIAVTSTDGRNIDVHFGKADIIKIYDVNPEREMIFVENRFVNKYCMEQIEHSFNQEKLESIWHVISDCKQLYTMKIGTIPAEKLTDKGMEIMSGEAPIIVAVEKMFNSKI